MKIYIVEDEMPQRDIYKEMLKGTGWVVETASNLLSISPTEKDVVVLDLGGTHSRLMSHKKGKVVTISGNPRIKPDLSKPFNKYELIDAIKGKIK